MDVIFNDPNLVVGGKQQFQLSNNTCQRAFLTTLSRSKFKNEAGGALGTVL